MEEDDETILRRTIDTFSLLAYQTSFVSAAALELFLQKTTPLFSYFAQEKHKKLHTTINELLSSCFKQQYGDFINNPYQFFKSLSQKIIKILEGDPFNKDTFYHLIESLLEKVLWSAYDQRETYESYLRLLKNINTLNTTENCNAQYIKRLSWILTERYCSFLELAGEQLSLTTIKEIKEKVLKEPLLMARTSEEKNYFSKRDRLLELLFLHEAKKTFNEQEMETISSSNKL